jgi:F0F1-type ATP synthase assembly protein I
MRIDHEPVSRQSARLSRRVKILYTLFLIILVPAYWTQYGAANFLWGSDIALFFLLVAILLEISLPASMMTLAVLVPELIWSVDFLARLLFDFDPDLFRGTAYMFDPGIPLLIRGLSLYHVALPVLLLWLLYRLGYDRRALAAQTLLCWIVFPVSYFVSSPEANINFVYGFGSEPQQWMPPELFILFLMLAFPLVLYLPMHLLLSRIMER